MSNFDAAVEAIQSARTIVASTGAGISTESGIPDFRSAGGIWDRYPVEEYATIEAFIADPAKIWKFWRAISSELGAYKPNPGHFALAELEEYGKLSAVITQNVDNLHQSAGSRRVVEYHGNNRRLRCLTCGTPGDLVLAEGTGVPFCYCGGIFKPDVVLFGELIPQQALLRAEAYARTAEVVIIVGTSAQVYPAAQLPFTAKENGAFIIECNLEATDFTHSITDVFLQGKAGTTLPMLAEAVLGPSGEPS